jgi:starch synthase (maltosyl-transferring)
LKDRAERAVGQVEIENVHPKLDCGEFPVKRVKGELLEVRADILSTGQEAVGAEVLYKSRSDSEWSNALMIPLGNDAWSGHFSLESVGRYEFTIRAWVDNLSILSNRIPKWTENENEDILSDIETVKATLDSALASSPTENAKQEIASWLAKITSASNNREKVLESLNDLNFKRAAEQYFRSHITQHKTLEIVVDPESARFASWYEMFHRSQGTREDQSATFSDCERRLPEIAEMGFDVIYLPPIHPIGKTNRRGKNNAGPAKAGEPGSPWAIGSADGGHKAINPDLGTMEDFLRFVNSTRKLGMDVAIDLAFQCSPDHPYVREHPNWFSHTQNGEIRYAENPPKKYYDIYPLCFDCEGSVELWEELLNVTLFWVRKGIKIFRVDNPHTKPFGFWTWLIDEVKKVEPEATFLSEAFTRPKVMKYLAKLGFTESYTYFAWKNSKWELTEFLNEFVISDSNEYYRGNFFTNTPDILTEYLQKGGPPAFKIRLVLAATLSSLYGIYNGYELCENRARESGSEEYLDSEKYQYKVWDWNRPGNIKDYIKRINKIRRENVALQDTKNLRILRSDNDNIFFYGKWSSDHSNAVMVAVNLDPFNVHDSTVYVPVSEFGFSPNQTYSVRDLITDSLFRWNGQANYVKLDPNFQPAHIFRVEK